MDFDEKNVKNNYKRAKLMKLAEKKIEKSAFFGNAIFTILGKWKKSNHQKCENFIKQTYFLSPHSKEGS